MDASSIMAPVRPSAGLSACRERHARGRRDAELHALFDESWERSLREDPIAASTLGDHRYDALWPDYSDDAFAKQAQQDRAAIAVQRRDPGAELRSATGSTAISSPALRRSLGAYDYGARYVSLSHQDARSAARPADELLPFASVQDYDNWNTRLKTLGRSSTSRSRCCAPVSRTPGAARIIIERVPGRIEKLIVADPTQSTFYAPLVTMPPSIPVAEQTPAACRGRARRSRPRSCRRIDDC
jgi:prolyl oligopeptidase